MKKITRTLALGLGLALAGTAAIAGDMHKNMGDVKLGDITLSKAWSRATPPKAKGGGAFVTIHNGGTSDAHLIAAQSDLAKRTEIHEMKVADGVMTMRQMKDGLIIPAGETLELKPGSYHIMFMGLNAPLKQGEMLDVTLQFEKAGSAELKIPVMKMGAKSGAHHHHGH
ncbi:copper chaperone PCu(A)C [Polycladidibacter hongkongensis]|uniref:copper chaperone PCu(A)C n=1 Tax=Polycladidibacter hongkongensis TaxID=1647556 RepID=UPI00082DB28A|nr:copper chaperone PCu(A)C [Pseudovibrio hongkongensis]